MVTEEDVLLHFGIKGMHWGVRRSKSQMQTNADHRKVAAIKKKKTPQLSNRQLKAANERMNLERNFNKMNPSTITRGQAKVVALLATVTLATTAYERFNSPAGKALRARIFPKTVSGKHFKP